jgi:hypothetical protein
MGEGKGTNRLFTPGEMKALAKSKVHQKAEHLVKRREWRWQHLLQETAQKRETRLGKCGEAWGEKTAEAKGKQREY